MSTSWTARLAVGGGKCTSQIKMGVRSGCAILPAARDRTFKETVMALSVGFIGVGNMGNPMASNVLENFALTVFDKSPKAMANLVQAGAKEPSSSKAVADRCERVMTCLPASPDVEALYR